MVLHPKAQPHASITIDSMKSAHLGGEYVTVEVDGYTIASVILTPEEALTAAEMIIGVALKLKEK